MSEYEEEMLLKELQKCGLHLRKLKEKLYRYCEKRVFVKGSTILKMYAKIEETQREKELQKCGLHLRKLKEKLYRYCEKRVFVKGSTILKMYAKIEETQREYNRLDNRLIELENAQ